MKLKLLALLLLLSFNLKGQGFYTDIDLDTLNLYDEENDFKGVTLDTTQVILGVIREETVTFPHYEPDANYYPEGDSILIVRLSTELGYKVGFKYFDYNWNLLSEDRITFIKPKYFKQ